VQVDASQAMEAARDDVFPDANTAMLCLVLPCMEVSSNGDRCKINCGDCEGMLVSAFVLRFPISALLHISFCLWYLGWHQFLADAASQCVCVVLGMKCRAVGSVGSGAR
jgi:hypothetical protein